MPHPSEPKMRWEDPVIEIVPLVVKEATLGGCKSDFSLTLGPSNIGSACQTTTGVSCVTYES